MDVFRIAQTRYIHDMSGAGARLYGGRWNPKGVAMVYTSESRALATAEYLVHVPATRAPRDLSIVTIQMRNASIVTVEPSDLPSRWRSYPALTTLAEIGRAWIERGSSLALRVPSMETSTFS